MGLYVCDVIGLEQLEKIRVPRSREVLCEGKFNGMITNCVIDLNDLMKI